jgi:hypothetical protein
MHTSSTAYGLGRRNPAGLLFVVAFHIAFVWILNDALGLRLLGPAPPEPLEARLIDERPVIPDDPIEPFVNMLTNRPTLAFEDPAKFNVPIDVPVEDTGGPDRILFTAGTGRRDARSRARAHGGHARRAPSIDAARLPQRFDPLRRGRQSRSRGAGGQEWSGRGRARRA